MRFKKIYIEITNSCNLSCSFCATNNSKKRYLSICQFTNILNKIKPYTNYIYLHVLGEPLMHPDINKLIDIASSIGFYINITTNGYLINKIKYNKNIRQLNISLHSFNEKYNISLDKYLFNIFDTVDELTKYNTYISLRLWVDNPSSSDMLQYINKKYHTNINIISNVKINNNIYLNTFHQFIWPDINNGYYCETGTCYATKDHIAILSNGTIVPCCLDTCGIINLGNIFSDNIEDIITSKRFTKMMDGFKKNTKIETLCKHCKFIEEKK